MNQAFPGERRVHSARAWSKGAMSSTDKAAAPSEETASGSGGADTIDKVVVHPLVMLSVTDHYNRVAKGTSKRVVGALLGSTYKGRVDVVNSFALPFAEDPSDPRVWFLDHFYLDRMYKLFRKVTSECRRLAQRPGLGFQRVLARS
jgi:hypothetical protein